MWYKILVEDEFIEYFSDENNIFTVLKDGEKEMAPMFARFRDAVTGVTYAFSLPELKQSSIDHLREDEPDIYRGFAFCREHQSKVQKDSRYLAKILHSIPTDLKALKKEDKLERLSAEQCAVSLMYPFWSRMGGSFEIEFQENGGLKKYLLALKKKVDAESSKPT